MNISKITLGTAQIGYHYGIANISGKPSFSSSIQILEYAWNNGINSFDTAPAYGNSEKIIGSFIYTKSIDVNHLIIISKLSPIGSVRNNTYDNIYKFIKNQIMQSLYDLKIKKIPIFLLHRASDMFLKDGIVIECLEQLKREGLVERIGISIYCPEEGEEALKFNEIDVIQVPINIFDHRLIKTNLLEKLKKKKYIIFARSIFLQGLFFIPPKKLPNYLRYASEPIKKFNNLINDYKIDIVSACILFARDLPGITSLVLGAEKIEQISKNIEGINKDPLPNDFNKIIFEEFKDLPEKLINPSLWNK